MFKAPTVVCVNSPASIKKIAIFASDVADSDVLIRDLPADVACHTLPQGSDSLEAMADCLAPYSNLQAVYLVAHGEPAQLFGGSNPVHSRALSDETVSLGKIAACLANDAVLYLYSCRVADGSEGRRFVNELADRIGCKVVASDQILGRVGDSVQWEMNFSSGSTAVPTAPVFSQAYSHQLSLPADESFDDDVNFTTFTSTNSFTNDGITYTITGTGTYTSEISNGAFFLSADPSDLALIFDTTPLGGISSIQVDIGGGTFQLSSIAFSAVSGGNVVLTSSTGGTVNWASSGNPVVSDPYDLSANAAFQNITSFTFSGTNLVLDLDDINFEAVGGGNDAPTATGVPADVTVTEDSASNFDLSAITLADDNDDSLTVTIAASAGTFSSVADGSGVGAGVTESGAGTGTVTLVGSVADINNYLDTASNLQYTGASNASGDDAASFTINVNDGTVNPQLGSGNIDITAVNDAPTATGVPTDVTVTEDTASDFDLSAISFADVEGDSLTVTIAASAGTFSSVADGSGIGAGVTESGAGTGTVTLIGSAADINSYLDTASNLQYTGASNANGNDAASFTINVNDGTVNPQLGSANIDITAVNDAPTATGVPTDVTVTEDTASDFDLSAISFADVEGDSLTVTIAASAGIFSSVADGSGVGAGVTESGAGTGTVTLVGSAADINSYLDTASNLQYTGANNASGGDAASFTVNVDDGTVNPQLGSGNIDITAVNDAPTGSDDTVDISYNGTHTFDASDFGFADADGDALQSVRIDAIPAAGTLTLNSNPVSNADIISIADINSGLLKFAPGNDESGNAYATLDFSVNDGTAFSSASSTLTLDVAAPPSPPPAPPGNSVDGVTVVESTATENGQSVTKISVDPVSANRQDSDGNGLADIPLHSDSDGTTITSLGLPAGVGFTARSNETASDQTSFRDSLYLLRDSAPASDWFSMINGLDQWTNGIGTDRLNQVTFSSNSSEPPKEPIKISGVAGDKTEVMVIDASQLPEGTVIDLENIEFAIIVGDVKVRGGAGSNVVFAGGGSQNIVLGADDDELHAGSGDDVVGSRAGIDLLFGDSGNDLVVGGADDDVLDGGTGNDILQGGASDVGSWGFALSKGELVGFFSASESDLSDPAGFAVDGPWLADSDSGIETDPRLEFSNVPNEHLQLVATLFKALTGELPTLDQLNLYSASGLSDVELAGAAVNYFFSEQGLSDQALEDQVSLLIAAVWGEDATTDELVAQGVEVMQAGGTWGEAMVYLVSASQAEHLLRNEAGDLLLTSPFEKLSESGWSAQTGDDVLKGGDGNDRLVGGDGDDWLDGGADTDVAVFMGSLAEFTFRISSNEDQQPLLELTRTATGETDVLVDIEFLEFGGRLYGPRPDMPAFEANTDYAVADFVIELTGQALDDSGILF